MRFVAIIVIAVLMLMLIFALLPEAQLPQPHGDSYSHSSRIPQQGIRFIEPTPATRTVVEAGQATRLPLGTPGHGAPALIIDFEILNEWKQPVAASIYVDGVMHAEGLINGEIHLPPEAHGLVLEFQANSYKPVSYTLNYQVKTRQFQQLTVQLLPQ